MKISRPAAAVQCVVHAVVSNTRDGQLEKHSTAHPRLQAAGRRTRGGAALAPLRLRRLHRVALRLLLLPHPHRKGLRRGVEGGGGQERGRGRKVMQRGVQSAEALLSRIWSARSTPAQPHKCRRHYAARSATRRPPQPHRRRTSTVTGVLASTRERSSSITSSTDTFCGRAGGGAAGQPPDRRFRASGQAGSKQEKGGYKHLPTSPLHSWLLEAIDPLALTPVSSSPPPPPQLQRPHVCCLELQQLLHLALQHVARRQRMPVLALLAVGALREGG